VSIFVVRHAKAGSRDKWDGDDRDRPLSGRGWTQARTIGKRLRRERVTGLYSSPYVRCMQSLVPLGEHLGLDVVADDRLAEGVSFEASLDLLAEAGDGAVLCSHGDVILELLNALVRRGTEFVTPPDWRKGSICILDAPDADGRIATAVVEPPPNDRG
jgi:8-oxo-dGTP diphosphatase